MHGQTHIEFLIWYAVTRVRWFDPSIPLCRTGSNSGQTMCDVWWHWNRCLSK